MQLEAITNLYHGQRAEPRLKCVVKRCDFCEIFIAAASVGVTE